jgi:branched-subunit amino acid ABC-type transport system permease component
VSLYLSAFITGIATGGIYALIAVGITQIFKVTRVLNFAHAGFVMWGAYLYGEYSRTFSIPVGVATLMAVASTALLGVATELIVFRIGARATNVNKIIATFGVLQILTALAVWKWGQNPFSGTNLVPSGGVSVLGTQVAWIDVASIGAALLVVLTLGAFLQWTRMGLLTRAVAEDAAMAEVLGARRQRISSFNWALGAAIGGLAGVLVANLGPFTNDLFLPFFAVALLATIVGGLQSLPLTIVGALGLGVVSSIAGAKFSALDASDAVLFLVIAVFVVVRRRWPAELSKIAWSKPTTVRDGAPNWTTFYGNGVLIAVAFVALIVASVHSLVWAQTGGLIVVYGLAALSLVPVLGWSGQISLAQGGLMGIGGFTFATAQSWYHLPFLVALLLALVAGVVFGALIGAITSHLSFVLTAVTTLAFTNGVGWLLNLSVFHTVSGSIEVSAPSFAHTASKQLWLFLICAAIVALGLRNLRNSAWGTRFLSGKTSPVMASHFGVNPNRMRVYGFAVSGLIAALAGSLYAISVGVVQVSDYDSSLSLLALQYAVTGGMGAVWGPFVATLGFIGIPQLINLNRFGNLPWPDLLGGIGVVQLVSVSSDGVTSMCRPPTHSLPGTRLGRRLADRLGYAPIEVHELSETPGRGMAVMPSRHLDPVNK